MSVDGQQETLAGASAGGCHRCRIRLYGALPIIACPALFSALAICRGHASGSQVPCSDNSFSRKATGTVPRQFTCTEAISYADVRGVPCVPPRLLLYCVAQDTRR